jgi:hypothetical protein
LAHLSRAKESISVGMFAVHALTGLTFNSFCTREPAFHGSVALASIEAGSPRGAKARSRDRIVARSDPPRLG